MKKDKTYEPQNLTFSSLLAQCPSDLYEYIQTLKGVDQRRDMHPEGDVFTHTQTVTDRVAKYGNINLSIAALMHDFGKDRTTEMNIKTGMPKSPNHQKYSAECVRIWSQWIREMGAEPYVVYSLVLHHMDRDFTGHANTNVSLKMTEWLRQQSWWSELEKLMDADHGGTDVG